MGYKTKSLSITTSEEVRIMPYRNQTTIHIDEPDIIEFLQAINNTDIVEYVQWNNFKPDDLFTEDQLRNWANEHGYIKE